MTELEIKNTDPQDLRDYAIIEKEILSLTSDQELSFDDRAYLHELLKFRAEVMSRILSNNVYPVKKIKGSL